MPEIPCFEAGVPVMMDMLFGQVKLGTVPSAMALKPCCMKRAMFGIADAARVLAGMLPEDPQRFANITGQASWQAYHKEMDEGWVADTEKRTMLVNAWRDQELGPLVTGCRTLMYPFGGPDILNAYQFFPKCDSYVLFGLRRSLGLTQAPQEQRRVQNKKIGTLHARTLHGDVEPCRP